MRTVRQLLEAKAPEVFAIGPDAPVIDAIRLMAEKRIGALLVMQAGKLAGILSERDYARKVVLQGRSSKDTPVRDIMTAQVVTIGHQLHAAVGGVVQADGDDIGGHDVAHGRVARGAPLEHDLARVVALGHDAGELAGLQHQ